MLIHSNKDLWVEHTSVWLILSALILRPAKPDKNPKSDDGYTPLHAAAGGGHLDNCKLLMDYMDNKNPKTEDGWTPLHSAAEEGHLEVCKLLMEYMDDKNPSATIAGFGYFCPKIKWM